MQLPNNYYPDSNGLRFKFTNKLMSLNSIDINIFLSRCIGLIKAKATHPDSSGQRIL